jgi:hypothetical protein
MTAQKNIEFTRVSQEIYGKPGEGPAAALLARRALMGEPAMGRGAAVAASVASMAAWGNPFPVMPAPAAA